jgi:hypothetical protein
MEYRLLGSSGCAVYADGRAEEIIGRWLAARPGTGPLCSG